MYCDAKGIKYIHGVECYLTEQLEPKVRDNYHTILLAKNYEGVKEINRLCYIASQPDHFYYRPRLSFDEFLGISDNVIKISACLASPLNLYGKNETRKSVPTNILCHYDYLEIQAHDFSEQILFNQSLIRWSKEYNIPLIAGTDTHSINQYKAECRTMLQYSKNIDFGDEDTFETLVQEAKKRNIQIILDGVFNHTGADSLYFNKYGNYNSLGAYQSKKSPYYEWYNFKDYPNKYECWWDVQILPRVKSDTPSYKKFILGDGGVIEKWMKKGIAGFRLDVADELSDDFLKTLNEKVKSINPNGIIYGEVWEDASNKIAYDKRKRYFLGNELDSVMNYPLREAIIDYVKNGDFEKLTNTFTMLYSHYPKTSCDLLMNVLGTHDTERILTVLGGESSDGYTNEQLSTMKMSKKELKLAINRLKMAYAINATVPGIPCIFYGDEAGMEGYCDPFNRLPFPWGREIHEIRDFYKKIGEIRTKESLYKDGNFRLLHCDSDVFAFARYNQKSCIITVVNISDKTVNISSSLKLQNLITGKIGNELDKSSVAIFKLNKCIDDVDLDFE